MVLLGLNSKNFKKKKKDQITKRSKGRKEAGSDQFDDIS